MHHCSKYEHRRQWYFKGVYNKEDEKENVGNCHFEDIRVYPMTLRPGGLSTGFLFCLLATFQGQAYNGIRKPLIKKKGKENGRKR